MLIFAALLWIYVQYMSLFSNIVCQSCHLINNRETFHTFNENSFQLLLETNWETDRLKTQFQSIHFMYIHYIDFTRNKKKTSTFICREAITDNSHVDKIIIEQMLLGQRNLEKRICMNRWMGGHADRWKFRMIE